MSVAVAQPQIKINRIDRQTMFVPIVGTNPFICHKFSEKAKRAMLDKMQGKAKVREHRDPEAEYQASMYRVAQETSVQGATSMTDGYGFPCIAFKAATVSAARFYGKDVRMTELRQCLFFRGVTTKADPQQLVEIIGDPVMREDMVRLSVSSTDLRYRAEFTTWHATLEVLYVRSALDQESVLSLIDAGGMGVGIGDWRPEKGGDYGTYEIDNSREIHVV